MTQAEIYNLIQLRQQENAERRLKVELDEAKRKVKQDTLNAAISILTAINAVNIMALMGGLTNEHK